MIQQEYLYFKKNFDKIEKEYPDKFILIKNEKIEGAFDRQIDAYSEGINRFGEHGEFFIHKVSRKELEQVRTFHPRVG